MAKNKKNKNTRKKGPKNVNKPIYKIESNDTKYLLNNKKENFQLEDISSFEISELIKN